MLVIDTLPVALAAVVGAKVTVKETFWPGLRVWADSVLMLNPVPAMLLPEIETAAVPVLESVTVVGALLLPTATLPKLTLAGLALSAPCVPVPLTGIERVPFVAVDVIVMLPDAVPVAVGANAVEKLAVAPAAIVWLALSPLALKPDPVVLTWLIVTVVFPEFVSVIVWVPLDPTTTPPKFTLPGLAVSVLPDATALPVRVSVCGEFPALSVKTMLPVAPVLDVGAN